MDNTCGEVNMEFAKEIRKARKKLGLTQSEIARRAGFTPPHWSNIERGSIQPTEDCKERINDAIREAQEWKNASNNSLHPSPEECGLEYSLVSVVDAAKFLSVSVPTVWRLIKEGTLPEPVRVSAHRIAFRSDELQDWMNNLQRARR